MSLIGRVAPEGSAAARRGARWSIAIGVLAGLCYCSWPLGYILNPTTTRVGLASDLAATGQPHRVVFVALDCVTGVVSVAIALAIGTRRRRSPRRSVRLALGGLAAFGLLTAVDALVPIRCGAALSACNADLHAFSLDDLLTGAAVFSLFAAAVSVHGARVKDRRGTPWAGLALGLTAAWGACGILLLSAHFSQRPPVTIQHVMLTLTSLVVATVPAAALSASRRAGRERQE